MFLIFNGSVTTTNSHHSTNHHFLNTYTLKVNSNYHLIYYLASSNMPEAISVTL